MDNERKFNMALQKLRSLVHDIRLVFVNFWKQMVITLVMVYSIFFLGFTMGRTTTGIVVPQNYYNHGPIISILPFNPISPPNTEKKDIPKVIISRYRRTIKPLTFKASNIIQPKKFKPGEEPHSKYIKSLPVVLEPNEEARCLALNIYFESRSEPLIGKYAVALVTMRRVKNKEFPQTICGVVWQKGYVKKLKKWVAHFSWTLDGRSDNPKNKREWKEAKNIAIFIYHNYSKINMNELGLPKDLLRATHYHARYVSPRWRHDYRRVAQIGLHLFYR